MSLEIASLMKLRAEEMMEEAYSQYHLLSKEQGVSKADKQKAKRSLKLLEEAYRLLLEMQIPDSPQSAWLRKEGEKARKGKGRSKPFKGIVKGAN
jgi:hypothetical protein